MTYYKVVRLMQSAKHMCQISDLSSRRFFAMLLLYSSQVLGNPVEVLTGYILNTSVMHYHYTNMLDM
jgi:hypothetical protein